MAPWKCTPGVPGWGGAGLLLIQSHLLQASAHTCAVAHFYTFFCRGKKGFGCIWMFLQEVGEGEAKWRAMRGTLLRWRVSCCVYPWSFAVFDSLLCFPLGSGKPRAEVAS